MAEQGKSAAEGDLAAEESADIRAAHELALALEFVDRARGHLLAFHHSIGHADNMLDKVLADLEEAGQTELATLVRENLLGRDVLRGCWTYQLVGEFDEEFWSIWRETEEQVRAKLTGGRRFVHESTLQDRRRAAGAGSS